MAYTLTVSNSSLLYYYLAHKCKPIVVRLTHSAGVTWSRVEQPGVDMLRCNATSAIETGVDLIEH